MLFVRKIKPEAWTDKPRYDSDSVSDLVTTNHELSVWRLDNIKDEDQLGRIALALAMSRSNPDPIYMVLIDPDKLIDRKGNPFKIELSDQDGDTRFEKMKDQHLNFMIPSIFELGHLASNIHNLLQEEDNIRFYTKQDIEDLFYKAYDKGEIDPDSDSLEKTKWKKLANIYRNHKGA